MSNIKNRIAGLNKKKLGQGPENLNGTEDCNCREDPCPLDGKCNLKSVIYEAKFEGDGGKTHSYVGLCSTTFIKRFRGHKNSLQWSKNRFKTGLSKRFWELKDEGEGLGYQDVKFSVLKKSCEYRPGGRNCPLCIDEKVKIIENGKRGVIGLNQRSELFTTCNHRKKYKLSSFNGVV